MAANFQSREMSASSSDLRICNNIKYYNTHFGILIWYYFIFAGEIDVSDLICDDSNLFEYEWEFVVDTEAAMRRKTRAIFFATPTKI